MIVFLAYHSVYFRSLGDVKAAASEGKFDASAYAEVFWNEKVMTGLADAVPYDELVAMLKADKERAFEAHSHALGIGNLRYFLIMGEGEITAVNENDESLLIKPDRDQTIKIATEFIYGNAVRDALGVLDMNDFKSTMDLNSVSEEINSKIRTEILPSFKERAQKGKDVAFVGAIELNRQYLMLDDIEVIPLSLTIIE